MCLERGEKAKSYKQNLDKPISITATKRGYDSVKSRGVVSSKCGTFRAGLMIAVCYEAI